MQVPSHQLSFNKRHSAIQVSKACASCLSQWLIQVEAAGTCLEEMEKVLFYPLFPGENINFLSLLLTQTIPFLMDGFERTCLQQVRWIICHIGAVRSRGMRHCQFKNI